MKRNHGFRQIIILSLVVFGLFNFGVKQIHAINTCTAEESQVSLACADVIGSPPGPDDPAGCNTAKATLTACQAADQEAEQAIQRERDLQSMIDENRADEASREAAARAAEGRKLINPLGTTDIRVAVGNVIKVLLGLSGVGAFAMFIYGGLTWMLSMGKSEAYKKGKDTMVYALLGLVVLFTSYTLVNFVVSILTGVTGG
jgi:hypothetical protein